MEESNVMTISGDITGKITFEKGHCKIVYYTHISPMYMFLFKCGVRGEGKGRQLLVESLKYIRKHSNAKIKKVQLIPEPMSDDPTKNKSDDLIQYYKSLGFLPIEGTDFLEGKIKTIIKKSETLTNISKSGVGGTKRRYRIKSRKTRKSR